MWERFELEIFYKETALIHRKDEYEFNDWKVHDIFLTLVFFWWIPF